MTVTSIADRRTAIRVRKLEQMQKLRITREWERHDTVLRLIESKQREIDNLKAQLS